MKSKYYLLFVLIVIMAAGARTMCLIAFNGMAVEHDALPDKQTTRLMFLALWFILMMVGDVLLINYKNIRYRLALIALLSAGVFGPVIYMFVTH